MYVGTLILRLGIEYAESLKDKRQVVKSLKERIRNRFNVATAETDDLEVWRRATIGVVTVSNDRNRVVQTLEHVVNFVEEDGRATVGDYIITAEQNASDWAKDEELENETFGFLDDDAA